MLSVLSVLCAVCAAGPLAAQEMWLGQSGARTLGLELLMPSFKQGSSVVSSGVAAFATLRWPIGAYERLVAEVAVARGEWTGAAAPGPYGYQYAPGSGPGTSLGNPYIGVETGGPDATWIGEFGVRVPLAARGSAALAAGSNADLERADAFAGQAFVLSGYESMRLKSESGLSFRVRAGLGITFGSATYHTVGPGAYFDDRRGVWIGYAVQAGYERNHVSVLAGLSGRLHENGLDQYVLSAGYALGGVRPGLSLRLPRAASLRAVETAVVGVTLGIEFGAMRSP